MNWAWAASLDQLWRSSTFPMWLTLAVVGFFGICVLVTLLRAERSIANVALTVITLLALGMAATDTIRGLSSAQSGASTGAGPAFQQANMALPALSCIDDLAGDVVLAACEKILFGSAENTAAALSYAASRITRLSALGDAAAANLNMTPELEVLQRSVERDRYGLMAQVLVTRDHCSPTDCAVYRVLTDHQQIATNMAEGAYDSLIARYAPSWNATPPGTAPVAMLSPSMPTGKPTNAEFPSAASTPPVSIMSPEPSATSSTTTPRPAASSAPPPSAPAPSTPPPPPRPATSGAPAVTAAKKPASPKHAASPPQHTPAPVQLSPPPGAQAPEASND